jgi:hypothetical protein
MTSGRLTVLVLGLLLLLGVPAPTASANSNYEQTVDLTFPVDSFQRYVDDYHHARSGGRTHKATDIMTVYGERVYAAVGGTITFITGITSALPSYGYMITIAGDDGRSYSYIHLGRQDRGPSEAYAPGMQRGVRVERGQWIGYAGCSGNASCSAPHLHFEIDDPNVRDPYGTNRINPYFSLSDAQRRGDFPSATGVTARSVSVTGDWNGDGVTNVGWWNEGGEWRLRMTNGSVVSFVYGRLSDDLPVVGDWNGDGRDTVGIFRPSAGGEWHLRNGFSGRTDHVFNYGRQRADVPVTGDWNGDGRDTVGIFRRGGEWHLRNGFSGSTNHIFTYGRQSSDVPLTGDWNGNGSDTVGIFRPRTWGEWHLRNRFSGSTNHIFTYGRSTDAPVTGDWSRKGSQTPGLVRGVTWYFNNDLDSQSSNSSLSFSPR